jgi:hypothetical protein
MTQNAEIVTSLIISHLERTIVWVRILETMEEGDEERGRRRRKWERG